MPSYPINAADGLCTAAAQAAALCNLVKRGLQCDLTKATPRTAAAEHASTTRIECGGWASLRPATECSRDADVAVVLRAHKEG